MKLQIPNPHIANLPDANRDDPPAPSLRSRFVTASPVEEFELRDGQTEALPEDFQALLCFHFHGFAECTAKGLRSHKAELVGIHNTKAGRRYWSPDSITCNQLGSGEKQRVMYVYNPGKPDMIHLMNPKTGSYIETLPAEDVPSYNDPEEQKKAMAQHRRAQRRAADRLQQLHQDDTNEAVDEACRNASEMRKAVEILELPDSARPRTPSGRTSTSTEVAEGGERVEAGQREFAEIRRRADKAFDRPAPVYAGHDDEADDVPFDPIKR